MKVTHEIIRDNIDTYKQAKKIFPAILQFEESSIDYTAMHALGLNKFADFFMFCKKTELRGQSLIYESIPFKQLKSIVVEKTLTERFKTLFKNRTQNKFDAIFSDKALFDRLLNGAWKSPPKMRRNGGMSYGTRKNERAEGLQEAIIPIINYIILKGIDIPDDLFYQQDRISRDMIWYTEEKLSFENVPQKEIEMASQLLQTFSEVVEKERVDFRKLNIKYIMSAISIKIKNAMKIPNGTMLKCVKDYKEKSGKVLLVKGNMYEVLGTYENNGFLTVYVSNEFNFRGYYEFSYFEDIKTRRDDLLSMLLE